MLLYQCDADYDEDFSFLQPLDLITKDVHELKKMINERRRKLQKGKNKESEKEHEGDRGRVREKERHEKEKESEKDKDKVENHKEQELHNENQITRDMVSDQEDKVNGIKKEDKVNGAKKEDKVNVKLDENEAFGGNHLFNGFGLHYLLSKCSMLHVWHFTLHSCIISIVLPICQCHTILYSFVSFNHFMFMHSFFFCQDSL
jgi:hypothetical protein